MTIGPFEEWYDPEKIVALDPWGHLPCQKTSELGSIARERGVPAQPSIAVATAELNMIEIVQVPPCRCHSPPAGLVGLRCFRSSAAAIAAVLAQPHSLSPARCNSRCHECPVMTVVTTSSSRTRPPLAAPSTVVMCVIRSVQAVKYKV